MLASSTPAEDYYTDGPLAPYIFAPVVFVLMNFDWH